MGSAGQIVLAWASGHALSAAAARLQIHRQFRKPLIVMSPKNLLRHPEAKSGLWEFDDVADDKGILGVRFKRVIMDELVSDRWAWWLRGLRMLSLSSRISGVALQSLACGAADPSRAGPSSS